MELIELIYGVSRQARSGTEIMIGCAHEACSHLAGLTPATRAELAKDLA